jgi:hypothetical protein
MCRSRRHDLNSGAGSSRRRAPTVERRVAHQSAPWISRHQAPRACTLPVRVATD